MFATEIAQRLFRTDVEQVARFDWRLIAFDDAAIVRYDGEPITHNGEPVTVSELVAILESLGYTVGDAEITPANRGMTARTTLGDGDRACDTAVTYQPVDGAYVGALVNGTSCTVGNGTKVGCDCWFSGDNGASARAAGAVKQGDLLFWNGSIAGFQLAPSDVIDFVYERD